MASSYKPTPVDFPDRPYHDQKFVAPTTVAEYYYDETKKSWIFSPEQASGGRITISDTPPSQRESMATDMWIDSNDYSLYVYDGDAMNWVGLTNFGITASVYVGTEPPLYSQAGALWFDNNTGDLKVSYVEYQPGSFDLIKHRYWVSITGNGINQTVAAGFSDVQHILDTIESRMEVIENSNYFQL